MSRKLIGRSVFVVLSLGFIWAITSAEPAKAAFSANLTTGEIIDRNGTVYTPVGTTCYSSFSTSGGSWLLLSPVYYYRSDSTGTTVPLAFTILRNTVTADVTDGGISNMSNVTYYERTFPACSLPPY